DQQPVGVGKRLGPRPVEMMRVARRQQAAARTVEVTWDIEAAQQRNGLLVAARGPDLLPVKDGRPLRIDEDVGQFLDVARVAHRPRRRAVLAGLGDDGLVDVDLAVENVARNFQVHRTGGAVEGLAGGHGNHVGDAFRAGYRRGKFGDGSHQLDMRQVLQRAHLVLRQRALAADVQNRALGAEGGGDTGHRIGAPRSRRRDDAAELAGLTRITVGRVRGDLFVAHVDDANTLIDAAVIDVDDVPAAQRENRVNTLVLQRFGNQVAARDHAGVAALALQSVFGGRGRGRGFGL